MKIYSKKDYKVYEYSFKNLDEFLHYIQTHSVNTNIFGSDSERIDSRNRSRENCDFTKTESIDEAIRLCENGWNEKFDNFLSLKEEVDDMFLKPEIGKKRFKDVVGTIPSVPDFICGSPKNMFNTKLEENCNIVEFYVTTGYPHYISSSQVYNRGAIILSLIDVLEKKGYGVRLTAFSISYCCGEIFLSYFNLKDETENLSLKRAYFPLCHPSFHRRLTFRLKEETPFKEHWRDGYGTNFRRDDIADIMQIDTDKSILITSPKDMEISGESLYEDLNSVLEIIKFDKYLKLK